jgi:hypothetical protein
MLRITALLACAALGAIPLACSSSSTAPTADQACGDEAHQRCSRLQTCSPVALAIRYGDGSTCEAGEKGSCVKALAAPSTGNSPQKVEACAMSFPNWGCTDYLNDMNIPMACVQATGQLTNGATCAFPGQCQSGFCAIAPGSACGACAAAPKAGDSCSLLTTCGPGMMCVAEQCATPGTTAMAACGASQPCGTGLSCVGPTPGMTDGKCQTAVTQSGATCDPQQKAAPGCDRAAGLTCNAQSTKCAAISVAPNGQACGVMGGQVGLCSGEGVCALSAGQPSGTCAAAAQNGASCGIANGSACLPPARCIVGSDGGAGGTCLLQDAVGCH